MSDQPQGPGWWQASDDKWYPPPAPAQEPPPLWQPGVASAVPTGYVSGYQARPRTWNGYAIASFVLALFGSGIGSILALVFGYKARREIILSGGRQRGRGF